MEGGVQAGEHELWGGEGGQVGDPVWPAVGPVNELGPDRHRVGMLGGPGRTSDGDDDEGGKREEDCLPVTCEPASLREWDAQPKL